MSFEVINNFNAKAVELKMRAMIGLYADTEAKRMEGEAKDQAPWVDRTSNARNSIQGNFGWIGKRAVITLSGNMDYSKWLELAHEKRFAILVPTIQRNAPEILKGYKKVIG